ncbi:MAG: phosphatase PAP2 family protein [Candidatus Liptonbacteria bacterium]|nr:phosphatase PAP2 family protein [Candidatus Liptonbacteria bacterium]
MQSIFYRLPQNTADCFRRWNLFWHSLAVISTLVLVLSGWDWWYFTELRNTVLFQFAFPAVIVGGLLPYFAPLLLYILGKTKKSPRLRNAAAALVQAEFIGYLISIAYKALTGRAGPPHFFSSAILDTSRIFHWGFLEGGVFWGWPSSHTTVAFAGAMALFMLYSDKKWVRYLCLAYALYIGLSVSFTIHWFSDFVAGAIMGTVVGVTVGRSFKKQSAGSFSGRGR